VDWEVQNASNRSSPDWLISDFEFIPLPMLAQRSYEIHHAIPLQVILPAFGRWER